MMKIFLVLFFIGAANAYVPTVESLFRNGSNPDIVSNGVSVQMKIKKLSASEDGQNLSSPMEEYYYKIFLTKNSDVIKLSQVRTTSEVVNENTIKHKSYFSNFSPYSLKTNPENVDKSLFYGILISMGLNNGSHVVQVLKSLGVPLKLNSELMNRSKVELLASYKKYLVMIKNDPQARKTLENPMQPSDAAAKDRVENIMAESMYIDTHQVLMGQRENQLVWQIKASGFEATFDPGKHQLLSFHFKTSTNDFEVTAHDYWMANGTHYLPRYLMVKTSRGESFQVELSQLRHYVEKEDDLINRLKNWDLLLKGKENHLSHPEFVLE